MNLLDLPPEIILIILRFEILDEKDIVNVSLVNKSLYNLSLNDEIWENLFKRRWKSLSQRCSRFGWLDNYKGRFKIKETTKKLIEEMAWKEFYKKDLSSTAFSKFHEISLNETLKLFMIDELQSIRNDPNKYHDLLLKFYCQHTIIYFLHRTIKENIQKRPIKTLSLEEGVQVFSEWHQPFLPEHSFKNVITKLDDMADEIWLKFITKYKYLPKTRIDKDFKINSEQSLELMKSISQYLYGMHEFKCDFEENRWAENSFINEVLVRKRGLPITLAIIFQLIAQRLGLHCDIIDFPRRVIIRYITENNSNSNLSDATKFIGDINKDRNTYFIDPFEDGKFLNYHELEMVAFAERMLDRNLEESDFKIANTEDILLRLARNLIANLYAQPENRQTFQCFRFAVEFSLIINPHDFEMRFLLLKLYLYLGIEMEQVIENLNELSARGLHDTLCKSLIEEAQSKIKNDQERKLSVCKRSNPVNVNVAYSIGMIMKHKKYNYICVIISWDPICQASQEWKHQMGVSKLKQNGEYQPFYHVLVDDGTSRYAAQENLNYVSTPKFINHPDIGIYFTEYNGTHYTPNARKMSEYPEDYEYTCEIVNMKYSPLNMQSRTYILNSNAQNL